MVQICSNFGITEGQTYCDANNNLFKCVNGSLVYQSSGCGATQSTMCLVGDVYGDIELENNQTYCGSDNKLYKCVNGSLIYQSSDCGGVILNPDPPVAGMIATPSEGTAPLIVTFRETSTGYVAAWQWDFGDGHYDSTGGATKTHTYTSPGTYTVIYTVGNITGQSSVQKRITVTVIQPPPSTCNCNIELDLFDPCYEYCITHPPTPPPPTPPPTEDPPVANVIANPSEGTAPLVVTFTDKTTGSTTAWFWSFGDSDTASTGGTKTHTYTSPGSYTVTYTVGNIAGNSTWKKVITVTKGVVTPTPKTCTPACGTGYICDTLIGECGKTTAPPVACVPACGTGYSCNEVTKTCVKNSLDGDAVAVPCIGLNRSGSLDISCIMEPGNEMYLYGAIGLVVLLILLKSR